MGAAPWHAPCCDCFALGEVIRASQERLSVNKIIYIIGLIVVVLAIASWLGLR
jgi:hypothetical protein